MTPRRRPAATSRRSNGITYPSLYDPTGKLMLRFPKGSLNPQAIPSTSSSTGTGRSRPAPSRPLSEDKLRKMLDPLIAEK